MMKDPIVPRESLFSIRRLFRPAYQRLRGFTACNVCGISGRYVQRDVLWPALIAEWNLSPAWARHFNEREGFACPHCYSSMRSSHLAQVIMHAVKTLTGVSDRSLAALFCNPKVQALKIAEINSAGSLHPFLAKCRNLRYSEYGSKIAGVPSESLMALSYEDNSFDLVVTSETLEHVPEVEKALSEIRRVLKPTGFHTFTVPVIEARPTTRQRATIQNGAIVNLLPPSYHGNPSESAGDWLVFNEFGADFENRCTQAGFATEVSRDKKNPALITFSSRKI